MVFSLRKYGFFLLILLVISARQVKAQYTYGVVSTQQDALQYLSEGEKEVLVLLNMVRTDGPAFAHTYLNILIESEGDEELHALREKLIQSPVLPPLQPLTGLQKAAFIQAKHLSSASTSNAAISQPFYDRIHQYVPGAGKVGESYSKGSNDPLLIVVQVLLGNEEDSRGGLNVLDPDLRWIGISIQADSNECYSTVMDLAGQPHSQFAGNNIVRQNKASANYTDKCPPGVMIKRRTGLGKLMKKIF